MLEELSTVELSCSNWLLTLPGVAVGVGVLVGVTVGVEVGVTLTVGVGVGVTVAVGVGVTVGVGVGVGVGEELSPDLLQPIINNALSRVIKVFFINYNFTILN